MHIASIFMLAACLQFAHVKAWVGSIHITYDRTVHASWALEHSYGSSDTTTHYTPSFMSFISFNGYDETWQGKPGGAAHIVDDLSETTESRPVRLEGSGPVLADPPLGKFAPDQFWINSVYALYSSAAVNAVNSRDGGTVDGINVHVENIPLPHSGTLSGSRHFHVPNPRNYRGGDQFHIPCLLIEWCSRDAGPGKATVSWTFTPGPGVAPHVTPSPKANPRPKCPNADGGSGARSDRLRIDFEKALVANGHPVSLGDIAASVSGAGIANGNVPAGSQFVAQKMLLGVAQQAGGQTRVTVRIVDVQTGVVERSALADVNGTTYASIQQAAAAALQKLGTF